MLRAGFFTPGAVRHSMLGTTRKICEDKGVKKAEKIIHEGENVREK